MLAFEPVSEAVYYIFSERCYRKPYPWECGIRQISMVISQEKKKNPFLLEQKITTCSKRDEISIISIAFREREMDMATHSTPHWNLRVKRFRISWFVSITHRRITLWLTGNKLVWLLYVWHGPLEPYPIQHEVLFRRFSVAFVITRTWTLKVFSFLFSFFPASLWCGYLQIRIIACMCWFLEMGKPNRRWYLHACLHCVINSQELSKCLNEMSMHHWFRNIGELSCLFPILTPIQNVFGYW